MYLDQLKLCVDGLGYVYVCECYVTLDECDEWVYNNIPLPVYLPCCMYWWSSAVVLVFRFMCEGSI